jgi:hypothetical protein
MVAYTPSVRNITREFRKADPSEVAQSIEWYAEANAVAKRLSETYGVTVEVAAGIIAALSPIQSWAANQKLAERFIAAGGLTSGYLKVGLAKASAILAGADIPSTLKGNKVTSFYYAIITSGKTDHATIDRHAFSVAVGERVIDTPSMTAKRYAEFVDCYRRAARILSREYGRTLTASEVQSATWVSYRRQHWAVGAFDLAA